MSAAACNLACKLVSGIMYSRVLLTLSLWPASSSLAPACSRFAAALLVLRCSVGEMQCGSCPAIHRSKPPLFPAGVPMQRLGAVATTAGGMRMTGEAALRSVCMPVHYCGLCKLLRDLLPCPAHRASCLQLTKHYGWHTSVDTCLFLGSHR